ncbi:MAG TPA: TCR/Tet family MFS transporter [Herpetosiphonaceae bacterium]|nr:TCR/Tet family MFS transporter [Herpetosiphonaceae bacterium]
MNKQTAGIRFIFITMVLDILGMGIVIPIMPQLITGLVGDISSASWWYGIIIAIYAAMQFVFAPALGRLSDRYGRRPVLLIALAGASLDYVLLAMAPNLAILVIGRIIAGITGASISVGVAYIADVTAPEERTRNFGIVGAAFGIGLVLGPVAGGLLGWFGPRVPFYAAAILTGLNWLYGWLVLPESLAPASRRPFAWREANPFATLALLGRYPGVRGLTAIFLLINLAQQALQSTWVLSTTLRFGWTPIDNGVALAVYGVITAVVQAWLLGRLLPRLGARRLIVIGLASHIVGFAAYAVAPSGWMMYAALIATSLCFLVQPAIQGIISQQADSASQGAIQGALTSLVSLTSIVGPLIATAVFSAFTGPAAAVSFPGAPFAMAAGFCALGLLLALYRPLPAAADLTPPSMAIQH